MEQKKLETTGLEEGQLLILKQEAMGKNSNIKCWVGLEILPQKTHFDEDDPFVI